MKIKEINFIKKNKNDTNYLLNEDKSRNKEYINTLNNDLTLDGIFRKETDKKYENSLFVFFSGYSKENMHFNGIYSASFFPGKILYLRDKYNKWYLKNKNKMVKFINDFIDKYFIKKTFLYGLSMGGFMALYASVYIDDSICLSFSPQIYNIDKIKGLFINNDVMKHIEKGVPKIPNMYKILKKNINNTKKYIFIPMSECNDLISDRFLWFDHILIGKILKIKNIRVIMLNANTHINAMCIDWDIFMKLLIENSETFEKNMDEGSKILANEIKLTPRFDLCKNINELINKK